MNPFTMVKCTVVTFRLVHRIAIGIRVVAFTHLEPKVVVIARFERERFLVICTFDHYTATIAMRFVMSKDLN
jgi:hypothetical protein